MKLRFGKTGQVEPLPSGRLVTSFDVPPGQSSPRGADPAVSPAPGVPAARAEPPAPADNLDAIASLVIERLSQSPLPEPIARIVGEVSERLVREEIARIREKARTPPSGNAGLP